ncbi:MAG: hypothetical protein AAFW81_06640 [Pseudomonadota bacterium]
MLETILSDVIAIFRATFLGGDWIGLAIAFGSVLIAALLMRRGTQIGSMTLLALVLFALGGFARGVFGGPEPAAVTGDRLAGQMQASWSVFMGLTAATLLAYFLAFMVLIILIFGLRSLFSRG